MMIKTVLPFSILIISFAIGCAKSEKLHSTTQSRYVPLSLDASKKLITPTVYFIPVYDQTQLACSEKKIMRDIQGQSIMTVCKNVFDNCLMQGTCLIRQGSNEILINVSSVIQNERRFLILKNSVCIFGIGSTKGQNIKSMCLDPYYSVAADLSLYNIGDVVFIPTAVGMVMPDGSVHDGYFIVRDSGGAITGYGRFDFFTGFSITKSESPLVQIGFGDKQTHVPYFVVTGAKSEEILKKRNYPILPVKK